MSQRWPKVIRDPVHGIIPFENNACDKLLLDLINGSETELANESPTVKQLAESYLLIRYYYPEAVRKDAEPLLQ